MTYRSFLIAVLGLMLIGNQSFAQTKKKKVDLPQSENITLKTKDGVNLRCTWFPGQNEKNSVPIILLHGFDQKRSVLESFGAFLQKEYGHAVIVPDIRGHGESIRTVNGDEIDREKFRKTHILGSLADIEACKKHLMAKNNEGELNIEMLTIVACEESCVTAAMWAQSDWSWPLIQGRKQGQDVKALIMISPKKSYKGLTITPVLKNPLFTSRGSVPPLAMAIAVGSSDARAMRDAKSIFSSLEKLRPKVKLESESKKEQDAETWEKQTIFYAPYKKDFQGWKLVDPRSGINLRKYIGYFIEKKLVDNAADLAWTDRSKK